MVNVYIVVLDVFETLDVKNIQCPCSVHAYDMKGNDELFIELTHPLILYTEFKNLGVVEFTVWKHLCKCSRQQKMGGTVLPKKGVVINGGSDKYFQNF